MPADAPFGKTFRELIVEVAHRKDMADLSGEVAAIPSDSQHLDLVKRMVNRGYARFLRADPQWSFIERTVTVVTNADGDGPTNLGGDAGRYKLPFYVRGTPLSNWRFQDEQSTYCEAIATDHRSVRIMRQQGQSTGTPAYAAVAALESPDAGGRSTAWELLLYPTPSAEYTIEADFNLRTHQFVEMEDRSIAGPEHDEAIIECAVALMDAADNDAQFVMPLSVMESAQIDAMNRTKTVGPWRDPKYGRNVNNRTALRTQASVMYFNGTAIT
jgi:hypothetical protein